MTLEPVLPPVLPRRDPKGHKGTTGRLLLVAGAVGCAGAARLSARGALAAGVGLLTVATPAAVRSEVAAEDPAFMTVGLPDTSAGTLAHPAARVIASLCADAHAVAIGPGLSRHEETTACVLTALARIARPAVVDADALNALSTASAPPAPPAPRVFTPHAGEAARLLRLHVDAVGRDRPGAARALAARLRGVVVLKGAGTLVTDGSRLLENPTGNPGLATGGSGDVLTGLVGAFLAAGMDAFDAACAAVYLHGEAADVVCAASGERAVSMRALLDALPAVVARREAAV